MPSPRTRTIVGVTLAAIAVVLGVVLVASAALVRYRLLEATLYTGSLERADVYDRTYTAVLADPELASAKEQLLGDLDLRVVDAEAARIYATNSLRMALPPSTLQHGTEAFVRSLLAYLRGDTDRLDGNIAVGDLVDRVPAVAVEVAGSVLAVAEDVEYASIAEYRAAVEQFAEALRAGRIPAEVPSAAATLAASDITAVLFDELGSSLPAENQAQIAAEVVAGNERDAAISAIAGIVEARAKRDAPDLRRELVGGREYDVLAALADRADTSEREVVAQLNTVRDAVAWTWPALVVGIMFTVAGLAAIGLLLGRRPTSACAVIAAVLAVAGGVVLFAWFAITRAIDSPLDAATGTGPGTWNLAAPIRAVVGDVESELTDALTDYMVRIAFVPIAAAALIALGLVAVRLLPKLRATRVLAVAGVAAAVVAGVVWLAPSDALDERACNGHPELCDRPYDEVVQAATHNSMSSPDVVFMWPEHDGTIRESLDAGIRALLIDSHYWPDVVSAEQLAAQYPEVPPSSIETFLALKPDQLRGRDGTFLCHNHCVFGGEPFVDGLTDVREFLDENPDEVVTLIVQDEITVADTVPAFTEAGLLDYVHTHEPGTDWPTLGELIDHGERLVVFAENEGPPPPWYHSAFEYMMETPYFFPTPEAMSCATNRGPDTADLFLMNHWVQRAAPDRRDSVVVNTHDFIVERARRCEDERGKAPNFVAVNFYGIGATTEAVDTLNGL